MGIVAIEMLDKPGDKAKMAVPDVLKLVKTFKPTATTKPFQWDRVGRAIPALNKMGIEPKGYVPVLVHIIKEPRLRPNTKNRPLPYRPEDRWGQLAVQAIRALERIGPEAKDAVPVLIKYVAPQDPKSPQRADLGPITPSSLRALGAIGPDAAEALPTIRAYRATLIPGSPPDVEVEKVIVKIKGE